MNARTPARPEPGCLLRGGRVLNVFTGEVYPADVLVGGGLVLAVGAGAAGAPDVADLDGAVVLPGFVDGHLHIESSLLTPGRLAEAVVPRGTTTVVADPHEIANVLGLDGVRWMLEASERLPLECLFTAPSCVPASSLETSGARLGPRAVGEMLRWDRVIGLAEVMDVAGVLEGRRGLLRKLDLAREAGRAIDGHAPGLGGAPLAAYVLAGMESDHECTTLAEAREKLRLGMRVMIREGSQARNLEALRPLVDPLTARRCLLVGDDRHALDLVEEGHVDHLLRRAVALGVPPVLAVQMVTLNAAERFGLRRVGAVAPGYRADLVAVDDLTGFRVRRVLKAGLPVAEDGRLLAEVRAAPPLPPTMRVAPLSRDALRIPAGPGAVRAIGLVPDQIETSALTVAPARRDGEVVADPGRDLAKLVVVERHRASGRVGLGLVRGFGLRAGALASSVAHDSHNLIAVGVDDGDLLAALRHLVAAGGGLAVAAAGEVRASLPLPVAGLMSDRPAAEVAAGLTRLHAAAAALGVQVAQPFAALSFLALPVVPALRLTDRGLVDVARGAFVPLALPAAA